MRLFKWNAAHAVYLPEIDAEHRALFQSAGELQHAVEGGAPPERALEMLHGLLEQMEDHFAHEERLMAASSYLSFDWHRAQHDTARKRSRQFVERLQAGDSDAVPLLLEFLNGWLRDHMGVADRIMGAYLRNYGRAHAGFAKAS